MIKIMNSQGIKVWVADQPSDSWVDCAEAISSLQDGALIECLQIIGSISENRSVSEYRCLRTKKIIKVLGEPRPAPFSMVVLHNPDSNSGEMKLRESFNTGEPIMIGVEYDTVLLFFSVLVVNVGLTIVQDSAITTEFDVEINSVVNSCDTSSTVAPRTNNLDIFDLVNGSCTFPTGGSCSENSLIVSSIGGHYTTATYSWSVVGATLVGDNTDDHISVTSPVSSNNVDYTVILSVDIDGVLYTITKSFSQTREVAPISITDITEDVAGSCNIS